MTDLKRRTLRAGVIKIGAQGANFLLRFGSLMIMARLLDPKDFGIVAMVTAVTGGFNLFKDAGLSMVTVQRPSITNEEVSTLFWVNMLVGVVLGGLSFALAPILVGFYGEPKLFWVTALLGLAFVTNAAGVQHSALLHRSMRFGLLTFVDILSQLASIAVGVVMAMNGFGFWALVWMAVVQPTTCTILLWSMTACVPGKPSRGVELRSMLNFGGMTTLNCLIMYVSYNLEKVLLGRFWGAEALGIYSRAFQLISIPSENLNAATGGVMFAALSRLQDDPARLKRYYVKMHSALLALSVPVTFSMALFADDIIFLVLGPKWKDAAVIFQLLAPSILALAMINPTYWLLVSIGKVDRSLKMAMVLGPVIIISYLFGLSYGPRGVAIAYSTAMMIWIVPHLIWCFHGTMLTMRDLLSALGRPFLSAILAVAVVYVTQPLYWQFFTPLPRLVFGCIILMATYSWLLLWVMGQKDLYFEIVRGLKQGTGFARAAA